MLRTYTTLPCQPSKPQPAHRFSRQETPRAHSNRNSPPTSPVLSLPLELCRPGSVAPASLYSSRIGGRGRVNIWLLVHCEGFNALNSGTPPCWIVWPEKKKNSGPIFFAAVRPAEAALLARKHASITRPSVWTPKPHQNVHCHRHPGALSPP